LNEKYLKCILLNETAKKILFIIYNAIISQHELCKEKKNNNTFICDDVAKQNITEIINKIPTETNLKFGTNFHHILLNTVMLMLFRYDILKKKQENGIEINPDINLEDWCINLVLLMMGGGGCT